MHWEQPQVLPARLGLDMPRRLTPDAFKRNILEALGHNNRLDPPRSDSGGEPGSYSVLEVEPSSSPRARPAPAP